MNNGFAFVDEAQSHESADHGREDGAQRRAAHAEGWKNTESCNEDGADDDIEQGGEYAEFQGYFRITGGVKGACEQKHEEEWCAAEEENAQVGEGVKCHRLRYIHEFQQRRCTEVAYGSEDKGEGSEGSHEGGVKYPTESIAVLSSGIARNKYVHAVEDGGDEDDEDEKDLPRHADGGIGSAVLRRDKMTHQNMVDDAMGTVDHVQAYERPRQFPYRTEAASTDDFQVKGFQRGRIFPVLKKELAEVRLRHCGIW